MTTYKTKPIMMALAAALLVSGSVQAANLEKSVSTPEVTIQSALHVDQGVSLRSELNKITTQTGIAFNVRIDISKDKLMQSVSADNWNDAIKNVLVGYNWVAIQDGAVLKSIIITGKNGDYAAPVAVSHEDPVVVAYHNAIAANDFDTWASYKMAQGE